MKSKLNKNRVVISEMFDSISHRYDFLNHFLSGGLDFYWRKRSVRCFRHLPEDGTLIDLCAGTGDMAFSLKKSISFAGKIILTDSSEKMLRVGLAKAERKNTSNMEFLTADSLNIPFKENSFHAAMAAFGIRNLPDPLEGICEIHRVLKPGGETVLLEFTIPKNRLIRPLYLFYFRNILPIFGGLISGKRAAYRYLQA